MNESQHINTRREQPMEISRITENDPQRLLLRTSAAWLSPKFCASLFINRVLWEENWPNMRFWFCAPSLPEKLITLFSGQNLKFGQFSSQQKSYIPRNLRKLRDGKRCPGSLSENRAENMVWETHMLHARPSVKNQVRTQWLVLPTWPREAFSTTVQSYFQAFTSRLYTRLRVLW